MKKMAKYILFWLILFITIMVLISCILNLYNYQFLNWVKYICMIISLVGVIIGTIQVCYKRKLICIILVILQFICISTVNQVLLLFTDEQSIIIKDGKRMVKEIHSILLSNSIEYYDYENIFVRGKQIRILENHDDSIGEYLYTTCYDRKGNVIDCQNYNK